jgi:hypothetical protein
MNSLCSDIVIAIAIRLPFDEATSLSLCSRWLNLLLNNEFWCRKLQYRTRMARASVSNGRKEYARYLKSGVPNVLTARGSGPLPPLLAKRRDVVKLDAVRPDLCCVVTVDGECYLYTDGKEICLSTHATDCLVCMDRDQLYVALLEDSVVYLVVVENRTVCRLGTKAVQLLSIRPMPKRISVYYKKKDGSIEEGGVNHRCQSLSTNYLLYEGAEESFFHKDKYYVMAQGTVHTHGGVWPIRRPDVKKYFVFRQLTIMLGIRDVSGSRLRELSVCTVKDIAATNFSVVALYRDGSLRNVVNGRLIAESVLSITSTYCGSCLSAITEPL